MERAGVQASEYVRSWGDRLSKLRWWHSFELPDGRRIEGVNNLEGLQRRIGLFPIAHDLRGKRVLDIGAWDGWFSFEMERRGAEVVAVDCVESRNFRFLQRELHSRVDYRLLDVYDLTPERLGRFDIVLFLGVLYHLKHPLLALERVCALARGFAAVQTFISPDRGSPAMEFFETDELGGQFDNWIAPNPACVLAMCRAAGFARAELVEIDKFSNAAVACFRHFEEPKAVFGPAPAIRGCLHMVDFGINFSSSRDEGVSVWFESAAENLDRDQVQISVGELHARPFHVAKDGRDWQANFKLPPGLAPGWHEVRVRLASGRWSQPARIAVDVPLQVDSLAVAGACDGQSWIPFEVRSPGIVALWVRGIPENGDRHNVRIVLGEERLEVVWIEPWRPGSGEHGMVVEVGSVTSAPVSVRLIE